MKIHPSFCFKLFLKISKKILTEYQKSVADICFFVENLRADFEVFYIIRKLLVF